MEHETDTTPGDIGTQGETEAEVQAAQTAWTDDDADNGSDAVEGAADDKTASYIAELERQVAQKDERLQATLGQYKEALDEFENAKARLRRDIGKEIEAGKRAILSELLEVVDNLERALSATPAVNDNQASLTTGVTMVRDQFLAKLQGLGVKRAPALGEAFNPSRFEAVSLVPVQDAKDNGMIIGVVRDCYLIGEETLRYGMVAVGKTVDSN